MSKPSRCPKREALKAAAKEKKRLEQALRARQVQQGLAPAPSQRLPNACSPYRSVEEERAAREAATTGQLAILRQQLPFLLGRLGKIPNPRQPRRTRHKTTVLLLYGLLMFVFQFASRREVNRELTRPMFEANLRLLFPELETIPHADTLYRLLRDIDVVHLEEAHIALVERLIRGKKFRRFLVQNRYPIAIDGTQKIGGDRLWDAQMLERTHGQGDAAKTQYYVYVLEASLSFRNGMVIPLLGEFLEHAQGDSERNKQDCELRAFYRLAKRLKARFPRLAILLLLDGLYANGPVMQRARHYGWDFMIVLKDASLPTVWDELKGLMPLQSNNRLQQPWHERRQVFTWVNDIVYEFGPNARQRQSVHVVVCQESWDVIEDGAEVTKQSRHAWLSSRPLSRLNVHERCNLAARYRWGIEAGFLVEKHQGYHYEHAFAHTWSAMKGYHLLMRMAHLFNTLARFAQHLKAFYAQLGVRGVISFIRDTCTAPWLDPPRVADLLDHPLQLQLR